MRFLGALQNLLLASFSLLGTLVIAEMLLRTPWVYTHLPHDPNRNSDYFRDEEFHKDKGPGTFRIFYIGDSFVFSPVVRREEMVDRLLEKNLSQDSGLKFEVFNLGKNGATPKDYYLYARQFKDYRPDLIIVSFYVDNDVLTEDMSGVSEEKGLHRFRVFRLLGRIPDLFHFFWPKKEVGPDCPEMKVAHAAPEYKAKACRGEINPHLLNTRALKGENHEYYDTLVRTFRENPVTRKYLSAIRGLYPELPVILLLQPSKYQVHPKYIEDMKRLGLIFEKDRVVGRQLQDEIMAWVKTEGMDVVDMLPVLESQPDRDLYLSLDDHYNSAGYALVAEALYQRLKRDYLRN